MKTLYSPLTLILLAATLFLLPACEKVKKSDQNYQEVEAYLKSGVWQVQRYSDSGTDQTEHFAGYKFTFKDDGYVQATDGYYSSYGTWKLNTRLGNTSNETVLTLVFHSGDIFPKLTKDWIVTEYTNVKIVMKEKSDDAIHLDYLTLEK